MARTERNSGRKLHTPIRVVFPPGCRYYTQEERQRFKDQRWAQYDADLQYDADEDIWEGFHNHGWGNDQT